MMDHELDRFIANVRRVAERERIIIPPGPFYFMGHLFDDIPDDPALMRQLSDIIEGRGIRAIRTMDVGAIRTI